MNDSVAGANNARDRRSTWTHAAGLLPVMMSAAAMVLAGWVWYGRHAAPRPEPPPVPDTPQSLAGAELTGDPEARVVLIQYSDFQCPSCRAFANNTWPAIKERYVDPGRVRVGFRHLPLPIHPHAQRAAMDSECAARQGRFWEMHDMLFAHQSELDDATGTVLAGRLGMDLRAFEQCLERDAANHVRTDVDYARALGVAGTPAFLLGTVLPEGTVRVTHVLIGNQPRARFESILSDLIAGSHGPTARLKASWRSLFGSGWSSR